MDCTICIAKTEALISCAVSVQLIWALVFAYAKSRFSHDMAHLSLLLCQNNFQHKSALFCFTQMNVLKIQSWALTLKISFVKFKVALFFI